jgi:hypothetical protein
MSGICSFDFCYIFRKYCANANYFWTAQYCKKGGEDVRFAPPTPETSYYLKYFLHNLVKLVI